MAQSLCGWAREGHPRVLTTRIRAVLQFWGKEHSMQQRPMLCEHRVPGGGISPRCSPDRLFIQRPVVAFHKYHRCLSSLQTRHLLPGTEDHPVGENGYEYGIQNNNNKKCSKMYGSVRAV